MASGVSSARVASCGATNFGGLPDPFGVRASGDVAGPAADARIVGVWDDPFIASAFDAASCEALRWRALRFLAGLPAAISSIERPVVTLQSAS